MQIDRLNHLLFPIDSLPTPAGKGAASDASAAAKSQGSARSNPPVLIERATPQPPSVLLTIQSQSADAVPNAANEAPVYSDVRKAAPPASDASDVAQMAQDHQQALARNAGVVTRVSVDKDGVLVMAKPKAPDSATQTAASAAPTDFVTMAVNTMREFADEAARQKAEVTGAMANAAASTAKLNGLQHLAARFKLFA